MISTSVTSHDPHCRLWAVALASFWGMSDDHDLDEPVKLTTHARVRVRYDDNFHVVVDRQFTLKALRPGHHAAMRFYFRSGKFYETEIIGTKQIARNVETVEVNAT